MIWNPQRTKFRPSPQGRRGALPSYPWSNRLQSLVVGSCLISVGYYCTFMVPSWLSVPLGPVTFTLGDASCLLILALFVPTAARAFRLDSMDRIGLLLPCWLLTSMCVAGDWDQKVPLANACRCLAILLCLPMLRRLSAAHMMALLVGCLLLALFVAGLHTYIQINNRYDLLQQLYNTYAAASSVQRQRALEAMPAGSTLMLAAAACAMYLLAMSRGLGGTLVWAGCAAALYVASAFTLMRSMLLLLGVIVPFCLLCVSIYTRNRSVFRRVLIGTATVALVVGATMEWGDAQLHTGFVETTFRRFEKLGDDANITDAQGDRMADFHAASLEILDNPIFGNGLPSLNSRTVDGQDIHPWMLLCLWGGPIGLMLAVWLVGMAIHARTGQDTWAEGARFSVLLIVLFFTINKTRGLADPMSLWPFVVGVAASLPFTPHEAFQVRRARPLQAASGPQQ